MTKKLVLIFLFLAFSVATQSLLASDPAPGTGKLTEKQSKELSKFKMKEPLINALIKIPGANKFKKDTLYIMKNFKIVQKIKGGYLITADPIVWEQSGHSMEIDIAFLKTDKKLESDLLITGAVYYAGEYKYKGIDGFQKSATLLQIPAGLPLSAIHKEGDPFKQEYY